MNYYGNDINNYVLAKCYGSNELKHFKYIEKERVNGKWRYYYNKSKRRTIGNRLESLQKGFKDGYIYNRTQSQAYNRSLDDERSSQESAYYWQMAKKMAGTDLFDERISEALAWKERESDYRAKIINTGEYVVANYIGRKLYEIEDSIASGKKAVSNLFKAIDNASKIVSEEYKKLDK